MAHRLRATVGAGPWRNAPSALLSLAVSSPLLWPWSSGGNASVDFELPAEPRPAPHDSMELRRDLSVSVVQALSLRGHATTYRRAESTTHFASYLHSALCSLTWLMCRLLFWQCNDVITLDSFVLELGKMVVGEYARAHTSWHLITEQTVVSAAHTLHSITREHTGIVQWNHSRHTTRAFLTSLHTCCP